MKSGSKLLGFDEYTIGKQLGQGGAGSVFEATASDGTLVAVKVLRDGLSSEKVRRFKNEIHFCQKNWHPGIIGVLDYGVAIDGNAQRRFYVMPRFSGTYREFMAEKKIRKIS